MDIWAAITKKRNLFMQNPKQQKRDTERNNKNEAESWKLLTLSFIIFQMILVISSPEIKTTKSVL